MSYKDWNWNGSGVVNGFMVVHDAKTMAWIEFLNDKVHGRTFMSFLDFSKKCSAYQVDIRGMMLPAVPFAKPNSFGNYYQAYLNLKYGL